MWPYLSEQAIAFAEHPVVRGIAIVIIFPAFFVLIDKIHSGEW
jgi:hypothetical protein